MAHSLAVRTISVIFSTIYRAYDNSFERALQFVSQHLELKAKAIIWQIVIVRQGEWAAKMEWFASLLA